MSKQTSKVAEVTESISSINRRWRYSLQPSVRGAYFLIAFFIFVVSTLIAYNQEPYRDPYQVLKPLSRDWWLSPVEQNAFLHLPSFGGFNHAFILPGKKIWAVGDNGLIVYSPDGGRHWQRQRIQPVSQSKNTAPGKWANEIAVPIISSAQAASDKDKGAAANTINIRRENTRLSPVENLQTQEKINNKNTPPEVNDPPAEAMILDPTLANITHIFFLDTEHGWAVGEGGVIFATENGSDWREQVSGSREKLNAVQFVDAKHGWAVGNGGTILQTVNGGQDWHLQASDSREKLNAVQFVDTQRGWVAGEAGTTLATVDGGRNWSKQATGGKEGLSSVQFLETDRGWAVGEGGTILATINGGKDWRASSYGGKYRLRAVTFVDAQHGWAVGDGGVILATVDGYDWRVQQSSGIREKLIAVQFVDTQRGWAVGMDGTILATWDGGRNWSKQISGSRQWLSAVKFVDALQGWAVGGDGIILTTVDGGQGWRALDSGTRERLNSVQFLDTRRGWAVGNVGTILTTVDGGQTWRLQSSGTRERLNAVQFVTAQRGWAVGNVGTILATVDGGQTWRLQSSGTRERLNAVQFVTAQRGWAVGNKGTILATVDGGKRWRLQASGSQQWLSAVQFLDAERGWAVGEGETILATLDGGRTWRLQASGRWQWRWLNAVQFLDAERGWAVGEGGTIQATEDGGQTWYLQASDSRQWLSAVQFLDAQRGWVVGEGGTILATHNGGQSWSSPLYKKGLAPWYYLSWLLIAGFLVPVLRRPKPQVVQAKSIANVAISDRPLRSGDPDPLHFQVIAQGLSRFLRNKNSEPPVTIAVTGKWGSGKSSLMNLLSDDLKRYGTKAVWFNAWHHQRQSQVLAALLENIRKQAIPSWLIPAGWMFRLRLLWQRGWQQKSLMFFVLAILTATVAYLASGDNFNKARLELRKVVSSQSVELTRTSLDKIKLNFESQKKAEDWVMLAPLLQANEGKVYASKKAMFMSLDTQASSKQKKPLIDNQFEILLHAQQAGIIAKLLRGQKDIGHDLGSILGGVLGPLFTLLLVFGTIWKNVGAFGLNPSVLLKSINGKGSAKQLRDQSSFRHQFAKEFEDVTKALKPYQMVIIIDDLDRCNPDAVLEVLEAVNFLVASGECYVVLGMDMDMVRSCVGLGYERLAEELVYEMNHETDDPQQKAKENRRDFARHYLEKLVNIEVPIPAPDPEQSRELLSPVQAVETKPPSLRQRIGGYLPGFICGLVPVGFMLAAVLFGLAINYYFIRAPKPVEPFVPQVVVTETNTTQPSDSPKQTVSEKPDAVIDNKPDSEKTRAGFTPGKSADYGWHHGYPVVMVLLLAALWMGIRRPDIVVTDSRDFKQALNIWYKVIAHYSKTPRSMKRFINRVRYLAMIQADGSVADALRHRVDKLWKRLWSIPLEEQSNDVHRIPEPILVALSAIYLGNKKKFITGQEEELLSKLKALPNILPADAANELKTLYADTVTEHNKLYSWPPTLDQIKEFLERCDGGRGA